MTLPVLLTVEPSALERIAALPEALQDIADKKLEWLNLQLHADLLHLESVAMSDVDKLLRVSNGTISPTELDALMALAEGLWNAPERVVSKSRDRYTSTARHMVCAALKRRRIPVTTIGMLVGGRDHTTIIHSLHQHNNLLATDKDYQHTWLKLVTAFNDEKAA